MAINKKNNLIIGRRKGKISSLIERDNEVVGYHWGKKTKYEISIEHKKINQEINNSVLINSMRLNAEWEKEQKKLTQKSNQAKVSTKRKTNLEKSIPWRLLTNLFPLILLVLEPNFVGVNFMIIWNTINESVWAFGYLVNWSGLYFFKSQSKWISEFIWERRQFKGNNAYW